MRPSSAGSTSNISKMTTRLTSPRILIGNCALPEWTQEAVTTALRQTAEALNLGMGKVTQPLRVAIRRWRGWRILINPDDFRCRQAIAQ